MLFYSMNFSRLLRKCGSPKRCPHCVSKQRANFGKLWFRQAWPNFDILGKQHQHTFKNDMHIQLYLSLHFYLLYLLLNV